MQKDLKLVNVGSYLPTRKGIREYNDKTNKIEISRNTIIELDQRLFNFVESNSEIFRTMFLSNCGKYACSSSVKTGFINNPFNIDLNPVLCITECIRNSLYSNEILLDGWCMWDCEDYFKISYNVGATLGGRRMAYERSIKYDPKTSKLLDFQSGWRGPKAIYNSEMDKAIVELLRSLCNVKLPIDLFKVSIADLKRSDEGYGDTYISSGDIGSYANKVYSLEGISLICEKNNFYDFKSLYGKYAMVLVL